MFTANDIYARVKHRPFVPLRIVTSAGQSFDIYHPDLILVGRRDLMFGIPSVENPAHYDQASRIAIMHITALEDLPVPTSLDANGQPDDRS